MGGGSRTLTGPSLNIYDQILAEQGQPPIPKPTPASPVPSGPKNIYDDILAQQGSDPLATAARQNREGTVESDAEKRARALRLSRVLGIPSGWIDDKDLQTLERQAADKALPYDEMAWQSPALTAWLAGEPDHAAVSRGDEHRLGLLEWMVKMPWRSVQISVTQEQLIPYYAKLRDGGKLTSAEQKELDGLEAWMQANEELDVGNSWFRWGVTQTGNVVPSMLAGIGSGVKYAGAGAVAGAGYGVAGAAVTLQPELVVPLAGAGAVLGGIGGFFAGGVKHGYDAESALAYRDFRLARDEFGQQYDEKTARGAAKLTGILNAGIEGFQLKWLTAPFKKILFEKGARELVKEALKSPTRRAAIAEAGKDFFIYNTEQAGTEAAQRLVTVVFGEQAKTGAHLAEGQQTLGTVNLFKQPRVENPDGSISTVDSLSVEVDGKEILLPTVTPDGRHFVGPNAAQQALEEYQRTGQHLGIFKDAKAADAYAKELHEAYEKGAFDGTAAFKSGAEIAGEVMSEFGGAWVGFAGVSIGTTVMTARRNVKAAKTAAATTRFFEAVGDATKASETVARAPKAVAKLMEMAGEQGQGITHVGADTERWLEYWQSQGQDPHEVAAVITGDANALRTAIENNTDLEMPIGEYATQLAPTPHNKALADTLRFILADGTISQNGREAQLMVDLQRAQAALENASPLEAEGRAATEPEQPTGAPGAAEGQPAAPAGEGVQAPAGVTPVQALQQISRDVTQQLITRANYTPRDAQQTARLLEIVFGRQAVDAGYDPYSVYQRYGFNVVRSASSAGTFGRKMAAKPAGKGKKAGTTAAAPAGETTTPQAGLPLTAEGAVVEDEAHKDAIRPGEAEGTAGAGSDAGDSLEDSRPAAAETDVSRTVRKAAGETPQALGRRRQAATREAYQQRRVAHFTELFGIVLAGARRQDPTINEALLRAEFDLRVEMWENAVAEYRNAGHDPLDLLQAIAGRGGINTTDKTFPGEVRLLQEGQTFGRVRGIKGVFQKDGQSLDLMATSLQQDPRFEWITDSDTLISAVDDAIRFQPKYAEGVLPGTATLRRDVGVDTQRAWWKDSWRFQDAAENAATEGDAVEQPGGDDTFDISEMHQMLLDMMEQPEEQAQPTADVLPTGEVQPRLPGAEGVREQEVATPTMEAPFALEREVAAEDEGEQFELFQLAPEDEPRGFSGVKPHLTPAERDTLKRNTAARLMEVFAKLPRDVDVGDVALAGIAKKGWYEQATEALRIIFGEEDSVRFAAVLAAMSPRVSVQDNFLNAVNVWANWVRANRPSNRAAILRIMQKSVRGTGGATSVLHSWKNNTVRALSTPNPHDIVLSGPKVDSFTRNLWGYMNEVTNDAWMAVFFNIEQALLGGSMNKAGTTSGKGPAYKALNAKIRRVAKALTEKTGEQWTPAHVQETVWSWAKTLYELSSKAGMSAEDFLAAGRLTDEAIATAPDFASLMGEDATIRSILENAGYGGPLEELAERSGAAGARGAVDAGPGAAAGAPGELEPGAGRPGRPGAGRLGPGEARPVTPSLLRAARRLDAVRKARLAAKAARAAAGVEEDADDITEFDQPAFPPLVLHHNLNARKLRDALKLGALPVPSFAITPAGDTIVGFGDITLIADAALADPKKGARVFGADVYSPRRPTVHFILSKGSKAKLQDLAEKWSADTGETYFDNETLEREGWQQLYDHSGLIREFMAQRGLEMPEPVMFTGAYARPGQIHTSWTRQAMRDRIREAGLDTELETFVNNYWDGLDVTEKIVKGRTATGRMSYTPHTLANVVAAMRKNLRGGEAESNIYGIGQLRAKFTPQFRSLGGIRQAAGRIVSKEQFEQVKEQSETELFAIREELSSYYEHGSPRVETVIAVLEDAPRLGLIRALRDYGFTNVPADVQSRIGDFLTGLSEMPTEYFEAKQTRAVQLSEFNAAVVPSDTEADVRAALEGAGVQVFEYQKAELGRDTDRNRREVVARVATDLSLHFQDEKGKRVRRASIQFEKSTNRVRINLFEKADFSSFLHESGHFFLKLLHDLSTELADVPADQLTEGQKRVMENYANALAALGVQTFDQLTEAHHEKFALSFESYLRDGLAPSEETRDLFITYRRWLLGLYKTNRSLGGNVSPELRKVFDRLLATDVEIAKAEERAQIPQMFTDAEDAGMTPQVWAAYVQSIQDARNRAIELLDAQIQGEVMREQRAEWKLRFAEVQEQVTKEVHAQPVYRALSGMRRGTEPDGRPIGGDTPTGPIKLNRADAIRRYGIERVSGLPPFTTTAEGGITADQVADLFGFTSGDQLLTEIATAPPMRQVILEQTQSRMIQEYGSMLLNGKIGEEAQAALANETRDKVIDFELRALARKRREVRPIVAAERADERAQAAEKAEEVKAESDRVKAGLREQATTARTQRDDVAAELRAEQAERRSANTRIRAAVPSRATIEAAANARVAATKVGRLNPELFWNAMQKSSRKAVEAAARGDVDEAIRWKTQQKLDMAIYRKMVEAKDRRDRSVQHMKDLAKPSTQKLLGQAAGGFLAQINGFLHRYRLAIVAPKTIENRAAIGPWLASLVAEGHPVDDLPYAMADDQSEGPWKELTVARFQELVEGISLLVQFARSEHKLFKLLDKARFLTLRDELQTAALEARVPKKLPLEMNTIGSQRRLAIGNFYAMHLKLAAMAKMLDGGKDGGIWWQVLVRPFNVADDEERTRKQEAGVAFERLYEFVPELSLKELTHVEGVGALSREGRLAVALNWGTATNRDRLLNDPTRNWTEGHIQAILDTLTENEWAYVRGTWEYIGSYWNEIADLQERVTGLRPDKVDAVPFMTRFGEMPGGYYPIVYDSRRGTKAQMHEAAKEAKALYEGNYLRATTDQGHNHPRVKSVRAALKLELNVGWTHVEKVIHDLTHREVFLDVDRMLRDGQLSETLFQTLGGPIFQQLKNVIGAIAVGNGLEHQGEESLAWMRRGTQIAGLGWRMWTAIQQPAGIINGAELVGYRWVLKGMTTLFRDPRHIGETVRWIESKSALMRDRGFTATTDTAQLRRDFQHAGGWMDRAIRSVTKNKYKQQSVVDSFLWHVQFAQRMADVPTWLGSYEKHMADPQEERTDAEHEERAVALADQAVIDTQGSGSIKDLSAVERGGPAFKAFMMFYSYGATTINRAAVAYETNDLKTVAGVSRMMASLASIYILPSIYQVLVGNLVGKYEDEGPWEYFKHVLGVSFGAILNGAILFREFGATITHRVFHLEDGGTRGWEGPAGYRLFGVMERTLTQIGQYEFDMPLAEALNDTGSIIVGYPGPAIETLAKGAIAMWENQSLNPFPLFIDQAKVDEDEDELEGEDDLAEDEEELQEQ